MAYVQLIWGLVLPVSLQQHLPIRLGLSPQFSNDTALMELRFHLIGPKEEKKELHTLHIFSAFRCIHSLFVFACCKNSMDGPCAR